MADNAPLSPQYPMLTPYQFASNNPIRFIDLDGLEAADPMAIFWSEVGKVKQSVENSYYTAERSVSNAAVHNTTLFHKKPFEYSKYS